MKPRKRTTCLVCGRDVAYTRWGGADPAYAGRRNLSRHNNRDGAPCTGSGLQTRRGK